MRGNRIHGRSGRLRSAGFPAAGAGLLLALAFAAAPHARAQKPQKTYDPGASDTEIRIGNFSTYTGWAQAYAQEQRAEAAYFDMINDRGGINGRKITFISEDTGSDPGKALSITQKLVEQDGVLAMFSTIGAEPNVNIRAYLNDKKVPQLFVQSASAMFDDPEHYPWTIGFLPTYRAEGRAYAKYILQTRPDAKIAILYSNDDLGREYLDGMHQGLGDKAAALIAREIGYRGPADPALENYVSELKDSGANVFLNLAVGPFATESIRAAYDLGWRPLQFIPNASLSVAAFLDPAGLEKSTGIISNTRTKGYLRPEDAQDPDVRAYLDWMSRYNSQASLRDQNNLAGYLRAEALVEVLRKCGDNLTRANVMKQAASLDTQLGMLVPGIRVKTSATDYQPMKQFYLIRFDGHAWRGAGTVIEE